MANEIAFMPRPGEHGLLAFSPEIRQQIYRYLLVDRQHSTIPVFLTHHSKFERNHFAISRRPLSAQLLRISHQILDESYPVLYMENKFTFYLDNNIARPRTIPVLITSGNIRGLQSLTINMASVQLLANDLHILLSALPLLQILGIDGNLLRTIDFYKPLECGATPAIQRCVDRSLGLLLSAFGGKALFRRFMLQNPSLVVEYTFGIAVDLILPATGEVVRGEPRVGSLKPSG